MQEPCDIDMCPAGKPHINDNQENHRRWFLSFAVKFRFLANLTWFLWEKPTGSNAEALEPGPPEDARCPLCRSVVAGILGFRI